jgi:hypothetical protein
VILGGPENPAGLGIPRVPGISRGLEPLGKHWRPRDAWAPMMVRSSLGTLDPWWPGDLWEREDPMGAEGPLAAR